MREQAEEILRLQTDWTSGNSPAMQRRGYLIRTEVTGWLREQLPELRRLMPAAADDLRVEGRDGTGYKSQVPWSRVYSESRSAAATEGFYIVYLFSADGSHLYLSLNQGTTRWQNGGFRRRPDREVRERIDWARNVASAAITGDPRLLPDINLGSRAELARAYERGNIAAFAYPMSKIPDDDQLATDVRHLMTALANVYVAADSAPAVPGEPGPEIADAVDIVTQIARPLAHFHPRHSAIHMSAAERRAIERRAVHVTTEHLKALGYSVKDVGGTRSYDLDARRGGERLYVEVKGTTSNGAEVLLTKNEVDLHAEHYPQTMLAIVTEIDLQRSIKPATAAGGTLRTIQPWHAAQDALQPIAYRYEVPEAD